MSRLPYPAQVALLSLLLLPVATWVYFNLEYVAGVALLAGMAYWVFHIARADSREVRRERMPERLEDLEYLRHEREFRSMVRREQWEDPAP